MKGKGRFLEQDKTLTMLGSCLDNSFPSSGVVFYEGFGSYVYDCFITYIPSLFGQDINKMPVYVVLYIL